MKKILEASLLLMITFILCACHECGVKGSHRYIYFVNNSKKKIEVQEFWSRRITVADSTFQCHTSTRQVFPDSCSVVSTALNGGWECDFNVIPFIQYVVMDGETFEHYALPDFNCGIIRENVPVLHVYRLTLEDLRRMNWTVVYPPEE